MRCLTDQRHTLRNKRSVTRSRSNYEFDVVRGTYDANRVGMPGAKYRSGRLRATNSSSCRFNLKGRLWQERLHCAGGKRPFGRTIA